MENFVPALTGLRNAKPEEIIDKLHNMFLAITTLGADDVVVAYQTVQTTARMRDMEQDPAITSLLDALAGQMHKITSSEMSLFDSNKERFGAVAGKRFRGY